MKRMIKNIREDNLTNSAIDIMLSLDDTNEKELFGVNSEISSHIPFIKSEQFNANVRTGGKLHKNVWKKEYHRGKDSRFKGNYTRIPRGRVFEFENDGFKVYVGDWIDDYPEVKEMIIDEFDLPQNTEFIKDIHWDIGHGWSEEYL